MGTIYENRHDRKSSRKTRDERQGHHRHRTPDGPKMRVTSGYWVILRDQVLEVRNVGGRLRIARKPRQYDEWNPLCPA
jgi:hypothetical protein